MKAVNVDEVLKILYKYGEFTLVTDNTKYSDMVDEIANLNALELEPATQQEMTNWTRVDKEPPKENGWYLCTAYINDCKSLTLELYYKNGKWLDNRRIDMFNTYNIVGYGDKLERHELSYDELKSEFDWTDNVVAWRLLPQSYVESEVE